MTPEERQAKVDFIIASHADFSAKMEQLDADLARNEQEHRTFRENLTVQDEDIELLKRLADQFLQIMRVEHEVLMADRQTRLAELEVERRAREEERKARQAELATAKFDLETERERRKGLEGRVDGIEEFTRILREFLEGKLRRPDKPPETEN